jgi:hypothetical protein
MLSALFSFLGGSVFRMIWGEVSSWLTARQQHSQEMDRMKLQGELDAAAHARNLEAIKVQADMGVKVIEVQAQGEVDKIAAEGWLEAVKATGRSIGVAWVDAWNAVIRPGTATWALAMLTLGEFEIIKISENVVQIAGAAWGIYLADRALLKRGK